MYLQFSFSSDLLAQIFLLRFFSLFRSDLSTPISQLRFFRSDKCPRKKHPIKIRGEYLLFTYFFVIVDTRHANLDCWYISRTRRFDSCETRRVLTTEKLQSVVHNGYCLQRDNSSWICR
jgi:hypothetical protein